MSRPQLVDTYAGAILLALQSKPFYAGTVAPGVVETRRAANKAARLARRGRGQRIRAGLTASARHARYRHLEQVGRRATTASRAGAR